MNNDKYINLYYAHHHFTDFVLSWLLTKSAQMLMKK